MEVKIGSRDGRSVGKDVKGGVGVIISLSVDSGVNKNFGDEVCRGVDGELNMLVLLVL